MSISHCIHCQHTVNGVSRTCPMCGGDMKLEIENKKRQCPRCKDPLTVFQFNNYQLDRCSTCEGLWLEPDKFKVLTTEFDVYRDDSSDPNFIRKPTPKAEGYLPCACCNKLMTRQNFKGMSGVIIDLCIGCGIWLDKGELKQIRSFIASGGLDKSQDREHEKHSRQTQVIDDRLSDVESMQKMLHKFSVKRIFFRGF